MRVAFANSKGGVGKTTSSIYLAAALHATGRVLLVDADPQQSATFWSASDPIWPFPVVSRATSDIHRMLPQLARGFDHVIVDTPPYDEAIIGSAVMAVDTVIIPASPTGLDLNRLMPTVALLAKIEPIHPVETGVLLTKVRHGTVSARGVRDVLAEADLPVLDTEIPLAEMFAASFGAAPTEFGAYEDLATELKQ